MNGRLKCLATGLDMFLSPYILIFPIILSNIGRSADFPYIKEARKAAKLDQNFIFQISTVSPRGVNERFSFN